MANPVVHFEIMGSDGEKLGAFYCELFGWSVQWMGDIAYGTVDTRAGSGINGGIGTSQTGASHVLFYVAVDDVRAALDRAATLGGGTAVPVVEMPGIVTFAHVADPEGNVIGVVQGGPGDEAGGPSKGDGAAVTWFEILGLDPVELLPFYERMFGWAGTASPAGGPPYIEIAAGTPGGIPGAIGASHDGTPRVNVYASVPDLQATCDKAAALGGGVAVPPTAVGGHIEFAHIVDPLGTQFGIWRTVG